MIGGGGCNYDEGVLKFSGHTIYSNNRITDYTTEFSIEFIFQNYALYKDNINTNFMIGYKNRSSSGNPFYTIYSYKDRIGSNLNNSSSITITDNVDTYKDVKVIISIDTSLKYIKTKINNKNIITREYSSNDSDWYLNIGGPSGWTSEYKSYQYIKYLKVYDNDILENLKIIYENDNNVYGIV